MSDDDPFDVSERWIGGRLGQPAWDDNDYTRDFQWLGQPRTGHVFPTLDTSDWVPVAQARFIIPPILERLLWMGLILPTTDALIVSHWVGITDAQVAFRRQLVSGPFHRVVRRRLIAEAEAESRYLMHLIDQSWAAASARGDQMLRDMFPDRIF